MEGQLARGFNRGIGSRTKVSITVSTVYYNPIEPLFSKKGKAYLCRPEKLNKEPLMQCATPLKLSKEPLPGQ